MSHFETLRREFTGTRDDGNLLDTVRGMAIDRLLCDVDTYTEWLGANVTTDPVHLPRVPGNAEDVHLMAENMEVRELIALSLYPATRAHDAACRELRERYISSHSSYLADVEAEIMAGL